MVWQSNPAWTSLSIGLNLAQGVLPLGLMYLTKLLVDTLASASSLVAVEQGRVWMYLGALGALSLLSGWLGTWQQWVEELQQLRFTDQIASIIQAKSIRMDLAYYENPSLQDTFHKAQYEAAYRPYQILHAVFQLIQSCFFLLTVLLFLLSVAWWLGLVLLLAGLPMLWVKVHFAGRNYELDRLRAQQEREAWYLHELLTTEPAARELRLYRYGELFARRYADLRNSLWQEQKRLLSQQVRFDALGQIAEVATFLIITGWVLSRALAGIFTLGTVVLYAQAFQRAQLQLRTALSAMGQLYTHRLFLNYLFDFLDLEPQVAEPLQPQTLARPLVAGFTLDRVSFQYPQHEQAVLQDISLELKLGQRIAIVGHNGSGKSTLLKLLARFYDPSTGQISLAGVDLRDLSLHDLRERLSVVFQDYQRYDFTAAENIRISNLHEPRNEERLRHAARQSGAASTIERLPAGYDTLVGHAFSGGEELSGGQWQQLAIARAFYAPAEVLILDEPSSAIDPLVEQAIFEQLLAPDPTRLVIFVTHRLYHLQRADRIVVMEAGRIVEEGRFEELMAQQGRFLRMFAAQQVG